jgi:Protein of unknown function (DUF3237)
VGTVTRVETPPTHLEKAFRADVSVGPVEDYGRTRAGRRRVVPILGGTLSEGVDAVVLAGGADWQILHDDGVLEIDTRYSARTPDGELLHLRTHGVRTGSPEVLEAVLRGESIPPTEYYFRIVIRIESAAPRFAALQDSILVGAAARTADIVAYDAYRLC